MALALALSAGVLQTAAVAGPADPRLATRLYNPDEIVRIEGRNGVQAAVAFAEDERIENVAIGDANSWQVTPNKRANILFVKPLAPTARTNLTVVTDRRSYYFDLVASPGSRPLYSLRFTYPAEPKPERADAAATVPLTGEEADLAAGVSKPVDPAQLNFAWRPKGKSALFPARIYDDGLSTYVSWAAGAPIPAILVRNEAGEEGPVNFAVRGDVIVIDGVPTQILLRSGRDSAVIENRSPRPRPAAPALAAAIPAKGD